MEYKKKLNEYYKKQHPDIYENQAFLKIIMVNVLINLFLKDKK